MPQASEGLLHGNIQGLLGMRWLDGSRFAPSGGNAALDRDRVVVCSVLGLGILALHPWSQAAGTRVA